MGLYIEFQNFRLKFVMDLPKSVSKFFETPSTETPHFSLKSVSNHHFETDLDYLETKSLVSIKRFFCSVN